MEKKITKLQIIEAMLNEEFVQDNEMYKTYLMHEKELLEKKRAKASAGSDKKAKANEALTEKLEVVLDGFRGTSTQIMLKAMKDFPTDEAVQVLSKQKVVALLKIMVANGTVKREEEKGKAIFSLV